MKFVSGVIRLSRYQEVAASVAVLSALGMFLVHSNALGEITAPTFLLVVLGNFLATTFAFMINDVEDAEDDARDPKKAKRNPISAGMLTHVQGTVVSVAVALTAMLIYTLLGPMPAVIGASVLLTGFLYSWRKVRLKGMPFIDMISHGYFLGSGALLISFLSFTEFHTEVLPAFLAVFLISLGGDLFNEIRDYESDRKAQLKNSVSIIGLRASIALRYIVTAVGLVLAVWIGVSNADALNIHVTVAGIVIIVALAGWLHFVAKRDVLDYDNALFYNTLLGTTFAVLVISTYT
ncbi:MAG: 4-hydroxybenzoate octaprenyltransferase [candidate division WS6 bacterium OLB20]|uniref:4-hydroxybenzoate octaprenyltransferase n=1 Tax=candidate division WS6 bacterium OLB20 TaxID=1617426 RepID=A0A136M081_9BACT|nr:MAG: 4-hydroxybenzoate octaprenyltransferase [candidate division WS6 bacterium OLB20]